MKINKHGLVINGLKAAAGKTENEKPYSNWHYMVFYDTSNGDVWTDAIYGRNSWNEYRDSDIVRIMDTQQHVTMQEIADRIFEVLTLRNK